MGNQDSKENFSQKWRRRFSNEDEPKMIVEELER